MVRYEFVVPGPLLGYKQTTRASMFHPKNKARSIAYGRFKEKVLTLAFEAGMPNIRKATKERPPYLSVILYWNKNPRIDYKNMYGSLEDGVFPDGDRYVKPGFHSDVHWDSGKEEAIVIIEFDVEFDK